MAKNSPMDSFKKAVTLPTLNKSNSKEKIPRTPPGVDRFAEDEPSPYKIKHFLNRKLDELPKQDETRASKEFKLEGKKQLRIQTQK